MNGYINNIESATTENNAFRRVLYTGQHTQLVVMSLLPGEEIGLETHPVTDQFIRVESGEGKVVIDGQEQNIRDGSAIVIPAGSEHNVVNTSSTAPLKLYTLYSPPHHRDGIVHQTKADAEADETDHL